MTVSQNGYTVPPPAVRTWRIPVHGLVQLPLRDDATGFVLAHWATLYSDKIEPLPGPVRDDWGGANRDIRGSTEISNHASYTAEDLNATRHPLGVRGTFAKAWQAAKIRFYLRTRYRGVIRGGLDYHNRPDEMHYEINADHARVLAVARRLVRTYRGREVLACNGLQPAHVLRFAT